MSETNMILKRFFLSVFLLNLTLRPYVVADDEDDEECSCVDVMMEEIKTCKDWEDAPVKFDVKLEFKGQHGVLNGKISVGDEINEGVEITVAIMLITPNGHEPVYSAGADICQSFKDDKAPWYPIVQVFNTTKCPIRKGEYKVIDVMISLHAIQGFLTKDFIGVYTITISIELAVKKIMCFQLVAEIYENTRPCSECQFPQVD